MADKSPLEPFAVDAAGAAHLCGMSRSQWFKLHSAGRVPLPVRLSPRCPRWIVQELRDWLTAACPNRQTWLAMKGVRR